MTQKFQCGQKARHKSTGRTGRILAVAVSGIGLIYQVSVGGTTLTVHEQDLEPY